MSTVFIDSLARSTATRSRRSALGAALGGLLAGGLALQSEAKNRNQHHRRRNRKNRNKNKKKNKAEANAFGCLNVGDRCDSTNLECCSGVCQKESGGKGKNRKSFCVSHDEGSCRPDQDICVGEDEAAAQCDVDGICFRTTGQAGFCGRVEAGECLACRTDTACEALFGPGAACVVCSDCDDETGGTACVPRATGQLPN